MGRLTWCEWATTCSGQQAVYHQAGTIEDGWGGTCQKSAPKHMRAESWSRASSVVLKPREASFYCSRVCPVITVAWFSVVLSLLILCMVPPKIIVSVTMLKTTVSCPWGPSGWLRGMRHGQEGTCWRSPYPVSSELFQIYVLRKSAFWVRSFLKKGFLCLQDKKVENHYTRAALLRF